MASMGPTGNRAIGAEGGRRPTCRARANERGKEDRRPTYRRPKADLSEADLSEAELALLSLTHTSWFRSNRSGLTRR